MRFGKIPYIISLFYCDKIAAMNDREVYKQTIIQIKFIIIYYFNN